jgi:hypothetical protein
MFYYVISVWDVSL